MKRALMNKWERINAVHTLTCVIGSLWNRIGKIHSNWAHPVLGESPSFSVINIALFRRVHSLFCLKCSELLMKAILLRAHLLAGMLHKALALFVPYHAYGYFKIQIKDTGNYPIEWFRMQALFQLGEVFLIRLFTDTQQNTCIRQQLMPLAFMWPLK